MSTSTKPKPGQQYNPGEEEYQRNFDTLPHTPADDDLEGMMDGEADSSNEDAAIERARAATSNAEANAAANAPIGRQKMGKTVTDQETNPAEWDSNVTPKGKTPISNPKGGPASKVAKRWLVGGAISTVAAVSGAVVAGVLGAFVSMKELTLDFFSKNTYSSYSKRATRNDEKRLFTEPDENCKGVKCRFKQGGVSDKEIAKYEKAGLKPEVGEKGGKKWIKSFSYVDEAGKPQKVDKNNFASHMKNSPKFRGAASVVSNPKALTYRAGHALKKYATFNIGRKNVPKNEKEHRKYIYGGGQKDVRMPKPSGEEDDPNNKGKLAAQLGDLDEDIAKEAAKQLDELEASDFEKPPSIRPNLSNLDLDLDKATAVGEGILKGGIKGALMGVFGLLDKACSGYTFLRTVDIGVKIYMARGVILYALLFMTAADKLKAGDMPAEEIAYMAGLLMAPSTEEGPDFGKTAANSVLFSMVVGGGKVSSKTGLARFSTGTPFLKFLQEAKKFFERAGANATTCKHVQSWYGQLLGIAGGILTGVFSGGTSTIIGVASSAAIGAIISVVTEYATPMLIAFAAGTVAPDPKDPGRGFAAGNAIGSGIGAWAGELGRGGNRYIKRSEAVQISKETAEEMARINAAEQYGKNPFALDNPYSITNQLALAMAPYAVAPSSQVTLNNLAALVASPFNMVAGSVNKLFTKKVSAFDTNFGGQFCADEDLAKADALTDASCNPIWAESDEVDNGPEYDPQLVLDYMVDNGHVDAESGAPKSDEYERYLRSCPDGTTPILPDGKPADVTEDIDTRDCGKTDKMYNMFRKYYQDGNIFEGSKKSADDTLGAG